MIIKLLSQAFFGDVGDERRSRNLSAQERGPPGKPFCLRLKKHIQRIHEGTEIEIKVRWKKLGDMHGPITDKP